ncbi:hypothetical protein PTUN_a1618 [Pseudoalteromonas tunicata]|jgi:hypothetical protein|uniref:Uncharacterized protein n=1 Tax=Pseudoalteromonas tunicata D2 TaxID=87626 RepID=A4CBD2_9GAMM|nr:hypothetical protein PTUN_a1618 [Pseudoalteromonas tunicata]EAR27669.1 hypothetical protein PTD2_17645 [Pseudoalteromonas tunicata D2]
MLFAGFFVLILLIQSIFSFKLSGKIVQSTQKKCSEVVILRVWFVTR